MIRFLQPMLLRTVYGAEAYLLPLRKRLGCGRVR